MKRYLQGRHVSVSLMYLVIFIIVILSAIALGLFQYMNHKRKIRQEEMHARKRRQFEELLKVVSDKNAEVGVKGNPPGDTSGADTNSES